MSEQIQATRRVRRGTRALIAGVALLAASACGGGGEAKAPHNNSVPTTQAPAPPESAVPKGMGSTLTTEQLAVQREKANKDVRQPLFVLFTQLTTHPDALTKIERVKQDPKKGCNVLPDVHQTNWMVSRTNANGSRVVIAVCSTPLPDGSGPDLTNPRAAIVAGAYIRGADVDADLAISSDPDIPGDSSGVEIITHIRNGDKDVSSKVSSSKSPENMGPAIQEASRVIATVNGAVNNS